MMEENKNKEDRNKIENKEKIYLYTREEIYGIALEKIKREQEGNE